MNYLRQTELSQFIKDIRVHFTKETGTVISQDENDEIASMTYLDLLVIICLRYVQG